MLFALIAFIVLLIVGFAMDELTWSNIGLCVLIAVTMFIVFGIFQWPFLIYTVVLAVLDIVLVLVIFKGDISI